MNPSRFIESIASSIRSHMRAVQTKPLNHARLLLEILPSQIGFPFLPSFLPYRGYRFIIFFFFPFLFSARKCAPCESQFLLQGFPSPPFVRRNTAASPLTKLLTRLALFTDAEEMWQRCGKTLERTREAVSTKNMTLFTFTLPPPSLLLPLPFSPPPRFRSLGTSEPCVTHSEFGI